MFEHQQLPTLKFAYAQMVDSRQLSPMGLPYRIFYPPYTYQNIIRDPALEDRIFQLTHYRRSDKISPMADLFEVFGYLPESSYPIIVGDRGTLIDANYWQLMPIFLDNRTGYFYANVSSFLGRIPLHRLIACTFVPNPDPTRNDQVNHKSMIKSQNWSWNLEWTNNTRNVNYNFEHGQFPNAKAVFTLKTKKKIIQMLAEGYNTNQIGIAINYQGDLMTLSKQLSKVRNEERWLDVIYDLGLCGKLKPTKHHTYHREKRVSDEAVWRQRRLNSENNTYGLTY